MLFGKFSKMVLMFGLNGSRLLNREKSEFAVFNTEFEKQSSLLKNRYGIFSKKYNFLS